MPMRNSQSGPHAHPQMHSALGKIGSIKAREAMRLGMDNGDPERLRGIENGRVKDDPQLPGLGLIWWQRKKAEGRFPRLIPKLLRAFSCRRKVGGKPSQLGLFDLSVGWNIASPSQLSICRQLVASECLST